MCDRRSLVSKGTPGRTPLRSRWTLAFFTSIIHIRETVFAIVWSTESQGLIKYRFSLTSLQLMKPPERSAEKPTHGSFVTIFCLEHSGKVASRMMNSNRAHESFFTALPLHSVLCSSTETRQSRQLEGVNRWPANPSIRQFLYPPPGYFSYI